MLSYVNNFLGRHLTEWNPLSSANMAFLALSDIGPVERTSSVVSAFFSIGSLAVGLHHVWRHRIVKDSDATQAVCYIKPFPALVRLIAYPFPYHLEHLLSKCLTHCWFSQAALFLPLSSPCPFVLVTSYIWLFSSFVCVPQVATEHLLFCHRSCVCSHPGCCNCNRRVFPEYVCLWWAVIAIKMSVVFSWLCTHSAGYFWLQVCSTCTHNLCNFAYL